MKQIIAISIFFLFSISCFSQVWVEIEQTDKEKIELDLSSMKRDGSKVYFWTKWTEYTITNGKEVDRKLKDHKAVIADIVYGKYTMYRYVFDCKIEKYQLLSFVKYTKDGNVLDSGEYMENKYDYFSVAPGSVASDIMYDVCENKINSHYIKGIAIDLPKDWTVKKEGNGKVYSMQCFSPGNEGISILITSECSNQSAFLIETTKFLDPNRKIEYTDPKIEFIGNHIYYSAYGIYKGQIIGKIAVININKNSYYINIVSIDEKIIDSVFN